ncbi:MAG: AMIN domain-containing protein [candidate division Zixibacteria bacterium]|nr:AMIN domain-containing protein [candidate division Zixibacteria bacterium]
MIKMKWYKSVIIVLLMLILPGTVMAVSQSVKNIDLVRIENMTVATIYADGKVDFTHKIISEAPIKVIVDIKGAKHELPQKDFYSLPSATIKSIRTSQFSLDPMITRVVFDIGKPVTYTVKEEGDRIVLSFPTPDDPDFTPWAAGVPSIKRVERKETEQEPPEVKKVVKKKPSKAPEKKPEAQKVVKKIPPAQPKRKGTVVKTRYKRARVIYNNKGTRDAFASLLITGKGDKAFGEIPVPAVEELKLVGILKDETDNIALLEDSEGSGFMLRAKDKVRNGWVSKVTDDRIYFQVSEFGWTRSTSMKLQSPNSQ